MKFVAGDCICVRGDRWLIDDATTFPDSTTLLVLSDVERGPSSRRSRLLLPFDRPLRVARVPAVRAVGRRQWAHRFRTHLSALRAAGELQAAQRASIDLLPFQLEPALALIGGHASRFLLADEVGLGKTIQAGLMLAELQHRGWCAHAIIAAPSGLRRQWADELRERFGIRAVVIDAAAIAALADSLPLDVNPWSVEPVVITSIDFLKQPEVLRGIDDVVWDAFILDEAHQATVRSRRYEAAAAVASRARYVFLLSATPHTGDERAFRELCALGESGASDRLLLFRRTREQAGIPRTRRAHLLPVAMTSDAIEMHRLLAAYAERLWMTRDDSRRNDLQLVAMVLTKRALSSATSLVKSVERRLSGLQSDTSSIESQTVLPFPELDDSDDPFVPAVAAFDRPEEEREVLEMLLASGRRAQRNERKLHALVRILRRVREPAIVFTEYRDTLDVVAACVGGMRNVSVLHGGQSQDERRASVAAFRGGRSDLLIATDAGSEGLNLHTSCRLVINLELPWNPMRLEQRIGRVDRIGQMRTVHAINLFASGTAEGTVLAKLTRRLERIRTSEIEVAACVIHGLEPPSRPVPLETSTSTVDLSRQARLEACRIEAARRAPVPITRFAGVVPITILRRSAYFSGASLIAFVRTRFTTSTGRLVEDTLLPVRLRLVDVPQKLSRRDVRRIAELLLGAVGETLIREAMRYAGVRAGAIAQTSAAAIQRASARERAIRQATNAHTAPLVQGGLFESRALDKRRNAVRHQNDPLYDPSDAARLECDTEVVVAPNPEIELLLLTC